MLFFTASVLSFYLGIFPRQDNRLEKGRLDRVHLDAWAVSLLYTVFTPWFALMMIWLFAFKAGWFPIGKFLDPVLWRDAPVDANTVFNRMFITVIAASLIVFAVFLLTSKKRMAGVRLIRLGSFAAAGMLVAGVWSALRHRPSCLEHSRAHGPPCLHSDSHQLRRHHAAHSQQHGRDHA